MDEMMTLDEYLEKYGGQPMRPAKARTRGKRPRANDKEDATTTLLYHIKLAGLPAPELEVLFHPTRKWRFDLAWPNEGIAMEIDGGIWLKTKEGYGKGHAHPKRFISDIHKLNEAHLQGWVVFRATPKMVRDGLAIEWLERAFAQLEER